MKKNIIVLTFAISTALFSCVNSDNYSAPDLSGECTTVPVTKTVQDIAALATGTVQQYSTTVDDVIEAYVTSSDEGGNFYKSISFVSVDGLKGFSIPVDDYNLYSKYEPGRKVFIKMKGRYFYNNSLTNALEIGSLYDNGAPLADEVGRISSVEYQNVLLRGCDKVDESTLVNSMSIAAAQTDANLNKLIEFSNVQFVDGNVGKTYFDSNNQIGGATNNVISDNSGNTIVVRVSEFANFASKTVPSLNGKIRGVLTKYLGTYQFMVRTENDINLTNPRFDSAPPLGGTSIVYNATLNEPFTSYTTTNQQVFPAYINDAVVGSRYWQVKTFSGNIYIQMSSFGGTPEANKAMFIVPVDLTAASVFSFKTKAGFVNGNCLKVYYSTNYTPGGNVNNATLVDITSNFTLSPGLTSGYPTNFTNSGNWNIPAGLTGNGFFIFEYTGNGNGGVTTTMQIDDIVIN